MSDTSRRRSLTEQADADSGLLKRTDDWNDDGLPDDETDTDRDGLTDAEEMNIYGTDWKTADSDKDGLGDGEELIIGSDPLNADTDGDGIDDGEEFDIIESDPLNADTDGDGVDDGVEKVLRHDPTKPDSDTDTDGDLLSDVEELALGTDWKNADSDGDGVDDGWEVKWLRSNPLDSNDKTPSEDSPLKDHPLYQEEPEPASRTDANHPDEQFFVENKEALAELRRMEEQEAAAASSTGGEGGAEPEGDGAEDGSPYGLAGDLWNLYEEYVGPDSALHRWYQDKDGDGLTKGQEHVRRLDDSNPDVDGDGFLDGEDPDADGDLQPDAKAAKAAVDVEVAFAGDSRWVIVNNQTRQFLTSGTGTYVQNVDTLDVLSLEDFAAKYPDESVRVDTKADGSKVMNLETYGPSLQNEIEFDSETGSTDKDDPAKTGHAGSGELEKGGIGDGDGEGGLLADRDGDGIPDSIDPDTETDQFAGDEDADGIPDAVDIDQLTIERETPVVEGARIDPNQMLAGDRPADTPGSSTVGTDPFGPASSAPARDDTSPVGKSVDPDDVASAVGAGRSDQTTGQTRSDSSSRDPFTNLDDPSLLAGMVGAVPTGDQPGGGSGETTSRSEAVDAAPQAKDQSTDDDFDIDLVIGEPTITGAGTGDSEQDQSAQDNGWIEGEVTGLDDEMTVDDSASGSDDETDDSAEGGDGSGSGDSPNFGGGMDIDRAALLDAVGGLRPRGTSDGTEMKATPAPSEQGTVREPTPVARMAEVRSPYSDSDGDGVPDGREEVDGTNPYDPNDYADADGDGTPDYMQGWVMGGDGPESDDGDDSGTGDEPATDDGVSTSGDPFGGDFYDRRQAEEALEELGAPQNGRPQPPIDPSRDDGGVEGRDIRHLITSDDLAQPVPDGAATGGGDRVSPTTDPGATAGVGGTGVIDPTPDAEDEIVADGPRDDDPLPDPAAEHDGSESTSDPELEQVELGTAIVTTPVSQPLPPGTNYAIGDPLGSTPPPEPAGPDDESEKVSESADFGGGAADDLTAAAKELDGTRSSSTDTGGSLPAGDEDAVAGTDQTPVVSMSTFDELDPISTDRAEALGLEPEPETIDLVAEPVKERLADAVEPDSRPDVLGDFIPD